MSAPLTWGYCLLLQNQECTVRKVITDNDYMIFLTKLGLIDALEVVMIKIILILSSCLLDENVCNNLQKWNKVNVDVNV